MSYGISKIGLEHLTVDLARELQGDGIAVNCFRIDLAVASEGFVANTPGVDRSTWEPCEVAAEGVLWMLRQPASLQRPPREHARPPPARGDHGHPGRDARSPTRTPITELFDGLAPDAETMFAEPYRTEPMPVFALWSAPRARSTAFFRSMLERGDLLALHEPLEGLMYFGTTEVDGRTFESPVSLLAWLRDETDDVNVFLKETTDSRVIEAVLADRRFLAEARHAFLIRRPEEIAASCTRSSPRSSRRLATCASKTSGSRRCTSCTPPSATPGGSPGRHRLRRPRGTTRSDDGGVLRSRRAAVHPAGAHLGARRTARVAAVRPLARGRQRQLRLRAARASPRAHRRDLRRAGAVRRPPPAVLRGSTRSASTSRRGAADGSYQLRRACRRRS